MSLWFWKVLHKGDVLLGICALLNNAFESTTNMFLFALWPLIKQLCTGKSSINVLWCYPRKGLANYHARIIIKVSLPQHSASRSRLQCLYIYEAPHLTISSFNTILESCPNLKQFGNLSRWAVNCDGIQQIVRTIRNNNLDVEILCGSHWFQSTCSKSVTFCI